MRFALGWQGAMLRKELEKRGDGLFVYLGYIPRNELRVLYAGCQIFCYPSRYEGFGLPVLEAMACGTPVVTSDRCSLPEVVGDAALMIDPTQPPALYEALQKVNDEATRQSLIAKGLKRAQNFTWERSAELMSKLIVA